MTFPHVQTPIKFLLPKLPNDQATVLQDLPSYEYDDRSTLNHQLHYDQPCSPEAWIFVDFVATGG